MASFKSRVSAFLLCALACASPIVEKRQAVGQIINSCTVPGTVAIAFDDGPYIYTSQALDTLDAAGIKATFFVNGQNYDNIYNYAGVLQRMANEGHQIGSHTWAHADLTTLDTAGITSQMTQVETALLSIIGKYPTYMRPPYFATNAAVLSTLGSLGYKVIQADLDSNDWQYTPDVALATVRAGLDAGGSITLIHDPLQATVQSILPGIIAEVQSRGLRAVPVGECLGDAPGNWYATGRGVL